MFVDIQKKISLDQRGVSSGFPIVPDTSNGLFGENEDDAPGLNDGINLACVASAYDFAQAYGLPNTTATADMIQNAADCGGCDCGGSTYNDCVATEIVANSPCNSALNDFMTEYGLDLSVEEQMAIVGPGGVSECGEGFEDEVIRLRLIDIGIEEVEFVMSNTDYVSWVFSFVGYNAIQEKIDYTNAIIGLKKHYNSIRLQRGEELYNNIISNIDYLVNDCLSGSVDPIDYADLFNHQLPQECNEVLDNLGDEFFFQSIEDAHSPTINFDHYSVEITTRPDFNGDQVPDSDEEIFESIKTNFLNLASGSHQNFESQCTFGGTSDISWNFVDYPELVPSSTEQWMGSSPNGTIFLITASGTGISNLVADNGAVIVSDYQDCCWIFSTIVTPESGSQPFSGHRQFGIRSTTNGLEFFTRAVDRAKLTPFMRSLVNDACSFQDYFNIGDITWTNLMNSVKSLTENNGGSATLTRTNFIRPKYSDILDQLKSDTPIQIDCFNN